MPKKKPGRHVVASWIWQVLNPEIEHLDFEAELIPRSLTFREHKRDFERLRPLREALMPDGRAVFDDMRGEQRDHDLAVSMHDSALDALREKAIALFDALLAHPPFRQVFTQIVEQLRGKGLTQTPGSSDEPRWLRMAAANVVNNLAGDLDSHFEDYVLWNTGHLEFKAAAPRQYVAPLQSTKAHFEHTVRATREKLAQMRRSLSREHDIPVVPSGSFG